MADIQDVIFLGAGASASEGAPVQKDLFREFFRPGGGYGRRTAGIARLAKFFQDFFGLDVRSDSPGVLFPSFEETLGVLEIAIDRGESFRGYSVASQAPDVQTLKEDLIFLIALVLNRTLMAPKGHHRDLVRRLADEGRLLSTAFISLNYDTLIDNALIGLHPGFDVDYGVEFTNYTRERDWKVPRQDRAVALYKLHGSLNWLYCPTCISLTLTPREHHKVAALIDHPVPCAQCGMPIVPIITPPSYLKGMKNYFLQQIMHRSANVLKSARRIVFCGYSFPAADLLIRYLLKRIELNYDPRPEIVVINSYEGKDGESKRREEKRYRRFFRNKDQVRYLDMSFSDFCNCDVD
ncbi:MAG: hypothetical protein GXY28_09045 [Bacteriovoracaceae bacterium]|nr:hypothetical protein [Bacteriovoracaceae bacterium]